ncbi:MAG: DUF4362 domain-containing protein [Roseburia sp.]|nr:DUF4362 domain-containing protein [Roseburia sp.]
MEQVLIRLANMSFQAGIVVCVVLAARVLLAAIKAPKRYSYLLWFIPFLRMIVPVRLESVFSLLPRKSAPFGASVIRETVSAVPDAANSAASDVGTVISAAGADPASHAKATVISAAAAGMKAGTAGNAGSGISLTFLLCVVWIAGIAALLLYGVLSCRKLQKKLSCSVHAKDNVYFADHIDAPFVLGFMRPRIYLPSDLDENEMFYVLKHERAHIRRWDPLIKIAAFLIVCIHWFNPLAWAAFFYFGKDMEMSCDETVLRELGEDSRGAYAQVLLDLSTGKQRLNAVPLAFGEGNTKDRIVNIMKYKKPLFVTVCIAVVLIIVLSVGFLTDPKPDGGLAVAGENETESTEESESTEEAEPVYGAVPVKEPLIEDIGLTSGDVILDYADTSTVIFHGPFGLFVYSMEEGRILRSLDLRSIGCEKAEGDDACEVSVSADGSTVYLMKHNFSTYVYGVEEHTLELTSYTYDDLYNKGVDLFEGLLKTKLCVQPDYTVLRSVDCVRVEDRGETHYIYMQSGSGMLADLCVYAEGEKRTADWHVFGQETPPAEQEIPPTDKETLDAYEQARQEVLDAASELKALHTLESQKTFLASLPNDIEQAKTRDDLLLRDEDINYDLWDTFYENVQSETQASLLLGSSTVEGDLIYTYLYYDGIKFYLLFDNTRDKWRGTGSEYEEAVYTNLLVEQYRAPGHLKEFQVAVLNNDPSLSYEDIQNSWLSSTYPPAPIDCYSLIFREADY